MKKIIFLSVLSYEHYFRKYLLQEMLKSGYQILFIFFDISSKAKIVLYLNGDRLNEYKPHQILKLIKYLKENNKQGEGLMIWNGLAFTNSAQYLLIRLSLPRAVVLYDIFDYFYYREQSKIKLIESKIKDTIYFLTSTIQIVLSKQLRSIYKKAYWLNNASHLTKVEKNILPNRIGFVGSIDERFDFLLMDGIAAGIPSMEIAIYGRIHKQNREINQKLKDLTMRNKNIMYYGPYNNDELHDILATFPIGLIPYIQNSILTKYINPDKFFHYLCHGLEVISTPIPATDELKNFIHISSSAEGIVCAINNIWEGKNLKNIGDFYKEHNWRKRLEELENLLVARKIYG